VVLSACFGGAALIGDTHFGRVCRRLGLSGADDPVALERDLGRLLPPERWTETSHLLNRHGRAVCTARKPSCAACPVQSLCPRQGVHEGICVSCKVDCPVFFKPLSPENKEA
jgi:endonuclease-3